MSEPLSILGLSKDFQAGRPAVQGLDLDIAAGEIVVLLGPSGCGKTTTLRCIAGLEEPSAGRITVGDRVFVDAARGAFLPPQQRRLGMVFQSYAVWPHMNVRQNVEYPLRRQKLPAAELRERTDRVLELVGLAALAERPVATLSGGQLQRVALARSLVYEPTLLLLDEPLSNLDAELRHKLRDDLRRIIKSVGLTAVYVTHDQTEAIGLADRIAVMHEGRLLQVDRPVDLYNRPASDFVARFTGATNRLRATVVAPPAAGAATPAKADGIAKAGADGSHGAVARAGDLELHVQAPAALRPGQPVDIVVRPGNVGLLPDDRVDAGATGATGATGRAAILRRAFRGDQTTYGVRFGDTELELHEAGSVPRFDVGDSVRLAFPQAPLWALPAAA